MLKEEESSNFLNNSEEINGKKFHSNVTITWIKFESTMKI